MKSYSFDSKEFFTGDYFLQRYQNYLQYLQLLSADTGSVGDWNDLLRFLDKIKLPEEYVLDDFRPKDTYKSALCLYARKRDVPHPSEKEFKKLEKAYGNISYRKDLLSPDFKKMAKKVGIYTGEDPFRIITLDGLTPESVWDYILLLLSDLLIGYKERFPYELHGNIVFDIKDVRSAFWYLNEFAICKRMGKDPFGIFSPIICIEGNLVTIDYYTVTTSMVYRYKRVMEYCCQSKKIVRDELFEQRLVWGFKISRIKF